MFFAKCSMKPGYSGVDNQLFYRDNCSLVFGHAKEIKQADSPGLAYDPRLKKLVAWSGGANLYILDLKNKTWIKRPPARTNFSLS